MFVRLIAALTAVFISYAAFAQGTPAQRAACRPDVTKFCKGKGDDVGVILQCLEDNISKISERCRKVIEVNDAPMPAAAQKKDETKKDETKKDEAPASAEKKDEKK
jgi:hypothetical protein